MSSGVKEEVLQSQKQTPQGLAGIRERLRPSIEARRSSDRSGSPARRDVLVCSGGGCVSSKSGELIETLRQEVAAAGLTGQARIVPVGCMGLCEAGPLVLVSPDGVYYRKVDAAGAKRIVTEHLVANQPVAEMEVTHQEGDGSILRSREVPFFASQVKIALQNCGVIDPLDIEEYIAVDGYRALEKVLFELKPDDVLETLKRSGLRGRGGAGFPAGLKWQFVKDAPGETKYIVCNADEGDPGAFMDRSIIEGDPHSVIEAMTIAGRLVGATQGYLYVRAEYPLAIERLGVALEQARRYGVLGSGILGTRFSFDLEIRIGAGAFVCGEETALMHSIEGKRGTPRPRPPFPAQQGLWKKPTLLNNVESWATVPRIILNGDEWFSAIGTERSKGTKVFALAGNVRNTGLVEVPMGISLREVVESIGGGIASGLPFKAAQSGGPSGGCIPASEVDVAVDYESLQELGAIMGSGGLIIMDDKTCMVALARFFIDFLADESCGKCPPCRIGTRILLNILERICNGEGQPEDLETIETLGKHVQTSSLCGLGQTAPNAVLSTMRHYRREYEEHIKYKRCTATVCNKIVSSPCQHTCPIDTKAATYIAQIAHGDLEAAWNTISMDNPLPGICGRVCHHPCERMCRAGDGGESIAIRGLKRFVTDYAAEQGWKPAIADATPDRKDKIAIVGAGPAGLACGHKLALDGFPVTIFESLPKAGGMLLSGIPAYRLPRDIIEREIAMICESGVQIECNKRLGREFAIDDLFKEGYKAVFLATGAHRSMPMYIKGEDADGTLKSMEFMAAVNVHGQQEIGKRVVVVGGGNSAVDAARIALRLPGCEKVTIVYRRTRAEMPAFKEEVDAALEEGIDIHFLATPTMVNLENGRIRDIDCIRMKLGDYDASGRRRPVPVDGSEFKLVADTLITAIGERPDTDYIGEDSGLKVTRWASIEVDEDTMATDVEGVFAGGDVVTGPNTVIDGIAAGKRAAESIRRFVEGESLERTYDVTRPYLKIEAASVPEEELKNPSRAVAREIAVERRAAGFDEVVSVLTKDEAMREARRCLRCDLG